MLTSSFLANFLLHNYKQVQQLLEELPFAIMALCKRCSLTSSVLTVVCSACQYTETPQRTKVVIIISIPSSPLCSRIRTLSQNSVSCLIHCFKCHLSRIFLTRFPPFSLGNLCTKWIIITISRWNRSTLLLGSQSLRKMPLHVNICCICWCMRLRSKITINSLHCCMPTCYLERISIQCLSLSKIS